MKTSSWVFALMLLLGLGSLSCKSKPTTPVRVLHSLDTPIWAALQAEFQRSEPRLKLAEVAPGEPADLILADGLDTIGDDLALEGAEPYTSEAASGLPAICLDPQSRRVCYTVSAVIPAYNPTLLSPREVPQTWMALRSKKFSGRWKSFTDLPARELIRSLEEKKLTIAILPLEETLMAWKQGSVIRPIYPIDGIYLVPHWMILTKNDESALDYSKKAYDWLLSTTAQNILARSGRFSARPTLTPPENARGLTELLFKPLVWNPIRKKGLNSQEGQRGSGS